MIFSMTDAAVYLAVDEFDHPIQMSSFLVTGRCAATRRPAAGSTQILAEHYIALVNIS